MAPEVGPPSRHFTILHAAIRAHVSKLLDNVAHLSPLAPDVHVDNVDRRVHIIALITLSYSRVIDSLIIPAVQAAANKVTEAVMSERPTKRPRVISNSPSLDDLGGIVRLHNSLPESFNGLRKAIAQSKSASMLSGGDECTEKGRGQVLATAKTKARELGHQLQHHLNRVEASLIPLCVLYLGVAEQGQLLVHCMTAFTEAEAIPDAFRRVHAEDLGNLLRMLWKFANDEEMRRITSVVVEAMSPEQWTYLCRAVPGMDRLVTPKFNPLIEIVHLHKAIEKELIDILHYCDGIAITDLKQLQSLAARMQFLRRVHLCHSDGEDTVLLRELNQKLASSPCAVEASQFLEDHDDDYARFDRLEDLINELQREARALSKHSDEVLESRKDELLCMVRDISDHIIGHMRGEEMEVLPLVRKHFSIVDQDRLMRQVMGKVPSEFLRELIPWMFGFLSVDEQESVLRNLMRSSPWDEVCKVVGVIAVSVQKGMTDRMQWNEVCLRVPEVEAEYKKIADFDKSVESGPVSEILRVHKAFRVELQGLLRRAKQIPIDGSSPNPKTLSSLADSVAFLSRMVEDHSNAEDEILLPRLEKRVPGISAKYKDDHCDERKLFDDLSKILEQLRCVGDEIQCGNLVKKLHNVARTLRDEMFSHLDLEEKHMWPNVTNNFTRDEQSEIIALIFGRMPGSRLRELLPWMIRMLSVSERNTMMNHILEVTKSTMFQSWLKTWLPLEEEDSRSGQPSKGGQSLGSASTRKPGKANSGEDDSKKVREKSRTAMLLLHGRENIERTMRSIARDESLPVKDRTMMMQQVMLAPYNELQANQEASREANHDEKSDRAPTYAKGTNRLGCDHYLRACKLRASCCNRLYSCRLCHDAAESHIMDRSSTTEILCMRCDTLQPVSNRCINKKCGKSFARYFCKVCAFYDDKETRSIYHCHSCNVCRIGKGLGQDYFHCMKCNQCMSMKYFHGHACIEKSMESDCPVCFQYMFTSTQPVKYMRCGHIMHMKCYKQYRKTNIKCPVCSKSLEEMTPLYKQIDEHLAAGGSSVPWEYRTARCDMFCHDCQRVSNTQYHFMYNKCPKCSSYNTRVDNIDANAGDPSRS